MAENNGWFSNVDLGDLATGLSSASAALSVWTGEDGEEEAELDLTVAETPIYEEPWFWGALGVGALVLVLVARR